jgi:hypothetical protein
VNNNYTWEFSPTTNAYVKIDSTAQPTQLNGLGYDALNNYLYSMDSSGGPLFQIGADGAETNIGSPGTGVQQIGADFLPNTNFLVTASNAGSFGLTDVSSPTLTTVALGESGVSFQASDITWTENSLDTEYIGYGLKGTGTNAATLYIVTLPVADIPTSSANWGSITTNPLTVTSDANITLSGGTATGSDNYGAASSDSAGDAFFYDNTAQELFEATSAQLAALGSQTFVFKASTTSTSGFVTSPNDGASCPNAASPFAAPTPVNDTYTIASNTTLSVTNASTSVFNNDQVVAGTSYNVDHVILEPGANQVSESFTASSSSGTLNGVNGTLDITNANLGYFTFTPNSGFTGTETFTYNIDETSPNNGVSTSSATVSINVVHQQVVSWNIGNDLSTSVASTAPSPATDLGSAPITYSVNTTDSNTADCSVDATTGVITYFTAGVCTIDASAAATSSYTAGFAELTFNVTSATIPTLSWNPSPTSTPVSTSGTTISNAPVTSSNGAITYAIASTNNTAGCTLASATAPLVLKSTTQGVCSVTASVAATSSFAAETITQPFAILATPTLSWAPSPTSFTTAQSPQTVVGVTTNSDGTITYAIGGTGNSAGCTLSSASAPVVLHFTTAGGCTVVASVAASTTYAAATISQAFSITTPPSNTITQIAPYANASTDTALQTFSDTLMTTGQSGTESFVASGSLPNGVTVSSGGVISSNATTPEGTYHLTGTDSDTSSDSGTWSYTLTVGPAGGTINQTTTTGSVNAGTAFTSSIATTGNSGAVTFTTTSSGNAFTVSSSGAVSAPNTLTPGTYTVSGNDTDAFGDAGTWSFALTVNPEGLTISQTNTTGSVNAGTAFNSSIATTNNNGPVTFTTTSSGNAFTVSSNGAITAPNTLGASMYTVSGTDTDAFGNTGTWTYTLTVTHVPDTITDVHDSGTTTVGTTFTDTITTSGNVGAVTFTTTSSGNAFTVSSSGAVSAPNTLSTGSYTVSGTDADSSSDTGTWTYTLGVTSASVPHTTIVEGPSTASVNEGTAFTDAITTSGNVGAVTFTTTSVTNAFSVNANGTISASPNLAPGVYTESGTDSDIHGDSGVWSFTLTVVATPPTITLSPPTVATVGDTYTPVVTTSGPSVTITSTTPSTCTVHNGVVTYIASGTCTLSFALATSANGASTPPILQHIAVLVPANVRLTLFDFANDKWTLTTSMRLRLKALALTIKRDFATHISVNGYASSTGAAAHNEFLSLRRAQIVTATLLADFKSVGVSVHVVHFAGHGATAFVSSDTAAPSNRRVSVYAW